MPVRSAAPGDGSTKPRTRGALSAWLASWIRRRAAQPIRCVAGRHYGVDLPGAVLDHRRSERILAFLLESRLLRRRQLHHVRPAPLRALRRVHPDRYLDALQERGALVPALGFDPGDALQDAYLLSHREQVAGTVLGARLALSGRGVVVNLGGGFHHALADRAQGFCVFNDVAVAVADRRAAGESGNVLVLDLDLHDGDGTRALFADDPSVHTFSIHNRHLGPVEASASTSVALGDDVEDATYLDAVDRLLPPVIRAVRPALVFYLAGVDPALDDELGNWRVSAEALLARDRKVFDLLRREARLPTVVLLAGGYGQQAWRHSARSLSALIRGGEPLEPPHTGEMTLARFRRIARLLRPAQLTAEPAERDWQLTEADLDAAAGRGARAGRFLDYYSPHGLELALERYGVLDKLRSKGFDALRVELQVDPSAGDTLRILSEAHGGEALIELRVRRDERTLEGLALLSLEWLALQNPSAPFTRERPRLPGQRHPGLGLLGDVTALLVLVCERLRLDGMTFVPAHYHVAAQAGSYFRFLDPAAQARFLCLRRALAPLRLIEAIEALESGRLRERASGEPVVWQPSPMVVPVSDPLRQRMDSAEYRAAVERELDRFDFVLAPPAR